MDDQTWSRFCGHNRTLNIWKNNDFGQCFEQIAIIVPTHVLLSIISVYYIAQSRHVFRHIQFKLPWFVVMRLLSVLMLLLLPAIKLLLSFIVFDKIPSFSDAIVVGISIFCWSLHSIYIYRLKYLLWFSFRGPVSAILFYLLTFVSACIQLHTVILLRIMISPAHNIIEECFIYVSLACHLLYIASLVPSGERNLDESLFSGSVNVSPSETEPLSFHDVHFYGSTTRGHRTESVVAEDEANILSKLSFHWVQPLMNQGVKQEIKTSEDIFLLPSRLSTVDIEQNFTDILNKPRNKEGQPPEITENTPLIQNSTAPDVEIKDGKNVHPTLLRALHSAFGVEYYLLGILKLLADAAGFAGPILLNYLVSFMEVKGEPEYHGYIYASALFVSTLFGSLCSSQFDYHVNVVGYKMRTAIITTIYKKALSVSSVSVTKFSSGQIINFMSTDTDRIKNFCPSFHALWSLPFQIAVSLYLLHQQVGLAFLAGLGFALILIPINRWLAEKIGKLSKDMMEQKDSRVKMMNEILYGMRVVKFYAWEEHFRTRIQALREAELKSLKGRKYLDAMCVYFWATTPVLISILTFTTYSLMGNPLTAAKVFTSLSLFLMLISPLNAFPWVINGLVEAWVSLKRVQEFICLSDLDLKKYYTFNRDLDYDSATLSIKSGIFSWKENYNMNHNETHTSPDTSSKPTGTLMLQNINIVIEKGQFVGIIGKVGSGKSSLLSAILAEMCRVQGRIIVEDLESGFALASQEPWIQHATVQGNILFGKPLKGLKYEAVLEAAALLDDLRMLPAGDKTEVGENGVTLSGGQKARVALARALYQDKEIYLLDDPLAAVDAHVAQHLYEKCIMGLLRKKTRILCTHHTKYLQNADLVILMEDGQIKQTGSPEDVLESVESLHLLESDTSADDEDKDIQNDKLSEEDDKDGGLVGEEEKETGVVKFEVYTSYWKAVGKCLAPTILISLFLMQGSRNVNDWWLSYWVSHTNDTTTQNDTTPYYQHHDFGFSPVSYHTHRFGNSHIDFFDQGSNVTTQNQTSDDIQFYLTVYGCLAGANSLFTLLRAFLFAYGGICAAQVLHKHLLDALLKAPIYFFDTTPIGRIVNRFSSDLYSIDDALPFIMNIFLAQLYGILGTIIITCIGLPWFALLLIPLGILYYKIQQYYRHTSRDLKRISSITLSPIYAHFSETVSGLVTIRAFRENNRFRKENIEKLDINQRAQFATTAAGSWLGFRLQMMGVVMVAGIAFIAVLEHHFQTVNPGLVGLAISYALSVTNLLSGVVNSFTETEKQMVSVERAQQYIDNIPSEQLEGSLFISPSWPAKGIISFKGVCLKYRNGLPNALNGVTFCTKPAEKIGIVGRTGSGKSSLFLALFRMVEIYSGEIVIDGMNVQHLDLKDLRSHLAIIPQDPFLFTGTVRENLDPTDSYDDRELWDALDRCHLQEVVERLGGLEADVAERGRHFSVGQRQLVCLARALLTKAKVLCIDEATANVDKETDKSLQSTIQREFCDSTVLTIAHRIETVRDNSDRVIVMSDGKVAEFDSPDNLLQDRQSMFFKLSNRNS